MQARPPFLEVFDDGAADVCFLLEVKSCEKADEVSAAQSRVRVILNQLKLER
jgi:hypothetical protein